MPDLGDGLRAVTQQRGQTADSGFRLELSSFRLHDFRLRMRALDDLTVLDLSHALAGPFASTMLADYGADVIKIETPGAATWRARGGRRFTRAGNGRAAAYFVNLHRNKKSVAIDLKHPDGKALFFRLLDGRRRRAREPARRRGAAAWDRLRALARAQPAHHLLLDLRLRPGRPVSRSRRARSDRPGRERDDQRHRTAGRPRRPRRRVDRRHRRRHVRGVRDRHRRSTRASAPGAASSSTCRCSKGS